MIQAQSTGGTVVAFRPAGLKSRRPAAPAGEARGAIILFTGTRYERGTVDGTATPAAPSELGR